MKNVITDFKFKSSYINIIRIIEKFSSTTLYCTSYADYKIVKITPIPGERNGHLRTATTFGWTPSFSSRWIPRLRTISAGHTENRIRCDGRSAGAFYTKRASNGVPPKADLPECGILGADRRAIIDNWSFSGDNFYSETYCARFPGHPTTATAKVKVDRPITIIVVSLRDTITITRYDRARLQIIVFVPGDRDGDRTTRFITIRRDTRTCRFLPQGRTIVCFFCFPRFVF